MELVKCLKEKANKGSKPFLPSGGIKFTLKKKIRGDTAPCLSLALTAAGYSISLVLSSLPFFPCSFWRPPSSSEKLPADSQVPWTSSLPLGSRLSPGILPKTLFSQCLIWVLSLTFLLTCGNDREPFILWTSGRKNTTSFSENDCFTFTLLDVLPTYS